MNLYDLEGERRSLIFQLGQAVEGEMHNTVIYLAGRLVQIEEIIRTKQERTTF
ncbi:MULTISPECIES: hypothetical protein [unclassified Exiguobacterium]|uniref:hypothetical protein n=1 Tax=unclassified Exiguobacterium TaxID=2644629 RepID=UPI001BE734BF|nr:MULTISPECIES: hypothetical protein [unclassified Exiguobacterium]